MLADAAQVAEGKLWCLGAGWSRIKANTPAPQALGIVVHVPFDMTNRPIKIECRLLTDDGEQVETEDDSPEAIGAGAEFEVGRPPGIKHGERLNFPLVLRFNGLAHKPGGYVWECKIEDEPVAHWPFRAT
jgi:hypothetical protein